MVAPLDGKTAETTRWPAVGAPLERGVREVQIVASHDLTLLVRHDETIYLMSFTSNYFAVNRSVFIKFIDSTKPVIPISNHDPGNAIIPY